VVHVFNTDWYQSFWHRKPHLMRGNKRAFRTIGLSLNKQTMLIPILIGSTCGCILFPFLKMNRIPPAGWTKFRLGFSSAYFGPEMHILGLFYIYSLTCKLLSLLNSQSSKIKKSYI